MTTPKLPFCSNSRQWLVFGTMNPRSCPYEKERCPACCGYYQEREPSKYVTRKMAILCNITELRYPVRGKGRKDNA